MMFLHEKLNIGYIEDLKVQILELPYAGYVSMFLLLPDEIAECSTGLELVRHSNFHCFKLLGLNLPWHMPTTWEMVCSFSWKYVNWLRGTVPGLTLSLKGLNLCHTCYFLAKSLPN